MDSQTPPAYAKRLALELPFTERCWSFNLEYDVFKVGGKIFMSATEPHERLPTSPKSNPQKSPLNQQIYPSTKPGYYMNKKHRISIYPDDDTTESLLARLVNGSRHRAAGGLPKRDQEHLRSG